MLYLWIYLIGVVVGLAVMRDPLPSRIITALVWPVGPVAFAVVVVILLAASAYLWPVPVLGAIAAISAAIYAAAW